MNNCKKINIRNARNRYQDDWPERSIFYNCRMFTEGFIHGSTYGEIEPCLHVGILDFNQLEDRGYHHKIMLMDERSGELYSSKFQFHVIELKKLEENIRGRKEAGIYRWARMDRSQKLGGGLYGSKRKSLYGSGKRRDGQDKIRAKQNVIYICVRRWQ